MFSFGRRDDRAAFAALDRSQAIIEFDVGGIILTANANFLAAMGYALDEIKGKHHGLFVTPALRESAEYGRFWDALRRGEYQSAEYLRLGKGAREIWIQATYNPIIDRSGKTVRIIKIATDITARKLAAAKAEGQVKAIERSQAVIEFALDGTVVTANENFLATLDYTLPEIVGKHHAMFVREDERKSPAYQAFWEKLRRGEFQSAEYQRVGKGGKPVWIQATYNPILDESGRPICIVKFAIDVTARVQERERKAELQRRLDAELSTITD